MPPLRPVLATVFAAALFPVAASAADPAPPAVVAPNENLLVDGVPPVPATVAETAGRYGEFRAATLADWQPNTGAILLLTRFADTNQVHLVKGPGGDRQQLTFYPDRVEGARFEPTQGKYFVFHKGAGGAEFFQNYRYDLDSGEVTLLTDGKSRNSEPVFSHDGKRLAYASTRRNGTDTDLYVQDPLDPKSDRRLAEVKGGGWAVQDWSPDGRQILVIEEISIAESYTWIFDAETGARRELTPRVPGEHIARGEARFSKDGKGIYCTTDKGSEFRRLDYYDLATGQERFLSDDTADVDGFDLHDNGRWLAFVQNRDGASVIQCLDTQSGATLLTAAPESLAVAGGDPITSLRIPFGVVSGLRWQPGESGSLAYSFASASGPSDVYVANLHNTQPVRWTYSETGGLNPAAFAEPKLVKWTSFDQREISGFLYAPDAAKFPGKRPVVVNIHGGPEAQYRPGFLGRNNYLVNELGCALVFPNVRGSDGYGKTFTSLDNGLQRDDSYKDIDALLDWVKTQPGLDAERIMVTGGSYGGHMTLAVSTFYADKIRCSVDVVGMSNLRTFLEHTESYRRDLRRVEYGDERDPQTREYLERIAPMNNATKITKPIFVVQGYNDPRVPRSEAEQIVATLKQQGTPVWFLMARDEGHGFAKKKNADFQFYATVEFIGRYLLN